MCNTGESTSWHITSWVTTICRVIKAIGKHVIAQDALTGAGEGVGIQESTYLWIIISGLEIIEPGFGIIELAVGAFCVPGSDRFRGYVIISFQQAVEFLGQDKKPGMPQCMLQLFFVAT